MNFLEEALRSPSPRFGDDTSGVQAAAQALLAALPVPYASSTFRLDVGLVKAFQAAYAGAKGLGAGGVDGLFGPNTYNALSQYVTMPPNAAGVVPPRATPCSPTDIAASIGRSYQHQNGSLPSRNMLATLTAQALVETAGGSKMYGYNIGNVHGKTSAGESAVLPDKDASGNVYYTNFRAYPTLDAGTADYVALICGRYSDALPFAEKNDLVGFATALHGKGYFEASIDDYASGLEAQNRTALAAADAWHPSDGPLPGSGGSSPSSGNSAVLDTVKNVGGTVAKAGVETLSFEFGAYIAGGFLFLVAYGLMGGFKSK